MDEAYRKQHFGRIRSSTLARRIFPQQWGATFQEDRAGLELAEKWKLVDNLMWANDYPHAEGTWPHRRKRSSARWVISVTVRARRSSDSCGEVFKPMSSCYLSGVAADWRLYGIRRSAAGTGGHMIEIGVFHNGASDLPVVRTSSGVAINDGNLAEVHESSQRGLIGQVRA